MANTAILIKRSTGTSAPTSLGAGELAYSYLSNTLFIGTSDGSGVLSLGGQKYVNDISAAASYANSAFIHANAAYEMANNSVDTWVRGAANSASSYANSAFDKANSAYAQANSAQTHAESAYDRANNSLDTTTGGTVTGTVNITGDLGVTGNLVISGNTITQDVETVNIADPLIYLASNNYVSDIVDIGFAGNYFDGSTQRHAGFVRRHGTDNFYMFTNYEPEPNNNIIDINDASFKKATLYANLNAELVTIGGVDIVSRVDGAFEQANTAVSNAAGASLYANGAFDYANSAYAQANTATGNAAGASLYANGAFTQANAAFERANSSVTSVTGTSGRITSTGGLTPVIDLDTVTVTPTGGLAAGNTISSITVDSYGRVTAYTGTEISILGSQVTSAVSSATNIAGGANKKIPYQTGSGVTSFIDIPGGSDIAYSTQVLTADSTGVPKWTTTLDGGSF